MLRARAHRSRQSRGWTARPGTRMRKSAIIETRRELQRTKAARRSRFILARRASLLSRIYKSFARRNAAMKLPFRCSRPAATIHHLGPACSPLPFHPHLSVPIFLLGSSVSRVRARASSAFSFLFPPSTRINYRHDARERNSIINRGAHFVLVALSFPFSGFLPNVPRRRRRRRRQEKFTRPVTQLHYALDSDVFFSPADFTRYYCARPL